MSLIQQALEKTGKDKPQEITLDTFLKKPTEKLPPKETVAAVKTKGAQDRRARHLKILLFTFFILIQAGIVYYFLILPNLSVSKVSDAVKKMPEPPPVVVPAQITVTPPASFFPKPKLAPSFILTGISEAGSDKFAIINNKVLAVGEEVSKNVTVVNILPEKKMVILQDQGREISLKL